MRLLTPILCLAATTALVSKQPPTIKSWRVAKPSARQNTIVFAITPGQALYQKFVVHDKNVTGEKTIRDKKEMEWIRDKEKDGYAAELIRAQEGSLELEQKYVNGILKVDDVSANGAVKYLGFGVFLEKDTPAVDDDSDFSNPVTITRSDLRDVAQQVVREVDARGSAAVIGHPGIGKTRGGLTYALQILLSRGEAVLRVGYKEELVYAFLPNENGIYEVWRCKAESWTLSLVADETTAYALIDPPERGVYKDYAYCKTLQFVSNNAEKHFQNFDKEGAMIIAAMPTLDEMLAMIPVLWKDSVTPRKSDLKIGRKFQRLDEKEREVRDRCALVGCSMRAVFSGANFELTLGGEESSI